MTYAATLQQRIDETGSALCVGIDPRPDLHDSVAAIESFCEKVIGETAEFAAVFKPNIAYFEALGVEGYAMMDRLIGKMKQSGVPIVLDAKRGDIGTTQEHYAKGYFENWDVDAVTLSPYMGFDSVEPFLQYPGKGVYLLGVTSNAGAADLETHDLADGRKVFELVGDMAGRAADSPAGEGSIGLVLGLTNVSDDVLARMPDVPLLIPGLGAQGGDLETLRGANRSAPSVINVSRGILYADDHLTFTEKAKDYANRIASIA
ncbi:MAG: orotidine-5'-phosphate decarboxylase [Verrucomicrobiales bacterium]|nr:orotidine-5'-phosphate decarboxylase [Verrucomicrobiales bacterium]